MNISLMPARIDERPVLENLLQLYIYDFSEFVGWDVGDDGRFKGRSIESYWQDSWRHPYLIRADGKLAGFALVHQRSRITGDPTTWDMAEFFVVRKYRRQGIGALIATRLFEAHRGNWEVRQRDDNGIASAFWRSVITDFTDGKFEEVILDDDTWHGPVQFFVSAEGSTG
jgi:predicted acetyltransferase